MSASREQVRAVVHTALTLAFGPDDADCFEDDPFHLGVSFEDGSFVDVLIPAASPAPRP